MTTIDEALIVKDILEDNWVAANVNSTTPTFYYDDKIKSHDYRKDAIKIYVRSGPLRKPKGLGYMTEEVRTGISIDIRCSDRARMFLLRDEVNRILNSVRKNPNSNYDNIFFDAERQVTGYANFWHYIIEITLKNNMRTIT